MKNEIIEAESQVITETEPVVKVRKERKKETQPRRSKGEGSIVWLADKRMYSGRVTYVDVNGKSSTRYFYSMVDGRKGEVVKKMDEFKRQMHLGFGNLSRDTLSVKITDWMKLIKRPVLKDASYDRIESIVNTQIIPVLGEYKLTQIDSRMIQEQIINRMMTEYSLSSIKKAYDALSGYFEYAVKVRDVQFNPMDAVIKPSSVRFAKKEVQILSDEDMRKFVTAATVTFKDKRINRYSYAYVLILNTGIRMGEALALKWTDVDFTAGTISISRNAIMVKRRGDDDVDTDSKRYLKMQDTVKSRSSNRIIHINKAALNALMNLKEENESEYVITTGVGKPVHPAPFQMTLDRICARAGIKRFGIHALRHTFASKMIEKGVDVKIVSGILGHSSVSITYDIYVHVLDKYKKDAVDVVDFT